MSSSFSFLYESFKSKKLTVDERLNLLRADSLVSTIKNSSELYHFLQLPLSSLSSDEREILVENLLKNYNPTSVISSSADVFKLLKLSNTELAQESRKIIVFKFLRSLRASDLPNLHIYMLSQLLRLSITELTDDLREIIFKEAINSKYLSALLNNGAELSGLFFLSKEKLSLEQRKIILNGVDPKIFQEYMHSGHILDLLKKGVEFDDIFPLIKEHEKFFLLCASDLRALFEMKKLTSAQYERFLEVALKNPHRSMKSFKDVADFLNIPLSDSQKTIVIQYLKDNLNQFNDFDGLVALCSITNKAIKGNETIFDLIKDKLISLITSVDRLFDTLNALQHSNGDEKTTILNRLGIDKLILDAAADDHYNAISAAYDRTASYSFYTPRMLQEIGPAQFKYNRALDWLTTLLNISGLTMTEMEIIWDKRPSNLENNFPWKIQFNTTYKAGSLYKITLNNPSKFIKSFDALSCFLEFCTVDQRTAAAEAMQDAFNFSQFNWGAVSLNGGPVEYIKKICFFAEKNEAVLNLAKNILRKLPNDRYAGDFLFYISQNLQSYDQKKVYLKEVNINKLMSFNLLKNILLESGTIKTEELEFILNETPRHHITEFIHYYISDHKFFSENLLNILNIITGNPGEYIFSFSDAACLFNPNLSDSQQTTVAESLKDSLSQFNDLEGFMALCDTVKGNEAIFNLVKNEMPRLIKDTDSLCRILKKFTSSSEQQAILCAVDINKLIGGSKDNLIKLLNTPALEIEVIKFILEKTLSCNIFKHWSAFIEILAWMLTPLTKRAILDVIFGKKELCSDLSFLEALLSCNAFNNNEKKDIVRDIKSLLSSMENFPEKEKISLFLSRNEIAITINSLDDVKKLLDSELDVEKRMAILEAIKQEINTLSKPLHALPKILEMDLTQLEKLTIIKNLESISNVIRNQAELDYLLEYTTLTPAVWEAIKTKFENEFTNKKQDAQCTLQWEVVSASLDRVSASANTISDLEIFITHLNLVSNLTVRTNILETRKDDINYALEHTPNGLPMLLDAAVLTANEKLIILKNLDSMSAAIQDEDDFEKLLTLELTSDAWTFIKSKFKDEFDNKKQSSSCTLTQEKITSVLEKKHTESLEKNKSLLPCSANNSSALFQLKKGDHAENPKSDSGILYDDPRF